MPNLCQDFWTLLESTPSVPHNPNRTPSFLPSKSQHIINLQHQRDANSNSNKSDYASENTLLIIRIKKKRGKR
ncbi:unnamed protein product [Tuber melanosporum]|uniref:(Perigord truffle) hypothetical protein n=1 Tax=Tuber melanosporum (strain Mel28) TaxID=656061 RepID=D5GHF3_TUBMM|nr:uncharacterized protein GSTUM_00007913001 [Tuber melanosporum]CAZ83946.1 unnamed protein product [Tuber melanosporum]